MKVLKKSMSYTDWKTLVSNDFYFTSNGRTPFIIKLFYFCRNQDQTYNIV